MDLEKLLGAEADSLLNYKATAFPADNLMHPGPEHLSRVFGESDRSSTVIRNLATMYGTGRLAGTGYLSILPVDQGIEHSAAASFAKNPAYFDPANLIELAIAADCSAIATTLGGLGIVSRQYAERMPFIVKLNHNDFLNYPNTYDQTMFGSAQQAADLGAVGVGATIYFGSEHADRQIGEVSAMFAEAHRLGLFTVLWCYLRNPAFNKDGVDYHLSADLTGQANHLGVTIEADIIKQKQPVNNGGYNALSFGKTDPLVYSQTDHRPPHRPDPLAGGQLLRRTYRADQLGWGVQGRRRPRPGRPHRSDQQAGRGRRAHCRAEGLPAAHRRGCRPHSRHPGRLPGQIDHHRLSGPAVGGIKIGQTSRGNGRDPGRVGGPHQLVQRHRRRPRLGAAVE